MKNKLQITLNWENDRRTKFLIRYKDDISVIKMYVNDNLFEKLSKDIIDYYNENYKAMGLVRGLYACIV
jgi:hypothetical protein